MDVVSDQAFHTDNDKHKQWHEEEQDYNPEDDAY